MNKRKVVFRTHFTICQLFLVGLLCFNHCGTVDSKSQSTSTEELSSPQDLTEIDTLIEFDDFFDEEYEHDSLRNYIGELIKIDSVAAVPEKTNERRVSFINKRIEAMIGRSTRELVDSLGCHYPPQYVLFRTFKLEQIFEIWIGNSNKDSLKKLIELPICAMDSEPGPKLVQGDCKTPEGYYSCKLLYGSSYDFMWMKLDYNKVHDWGVTNEGSSFKICIDYPHDIDRRRTRKFIGKQSPGGEICIHGNCVTAGCISFKNKNFLPVYHMAKCHNKAKYGDPMIYIYPFKFSKANKETYASTNARWGSSTMDSLNILSFWNNLEEGYDLFEKNHRPLRITRAKYKYIYK